MNLDLDLSVFSRFFRGITTELRQNKLLAGLAAVLVVALAAVPFLLSKSSGPAPAPQAALPSSTPPASGTSIPALDVQTTPSQSHLSGPSRNPFGTSGSTTPSSSTAASTTTTSTAVSTAVSTAGRSAVSTVTGNSSGGSSTLPTVPIPGLRGSSTPLPATTTTTPPTTPKVTSKPSVTALAADQSYDVTLAITNASGGLNTLDGLKRLSALPSRHQPLLVDLGVLKGGHRVLFAVEPGAVVRGGGSCIPGPIDCEVLSLGANETESVATGAGLVAAVFEVTGIGKHTYTSQTAAQKARHSYAASGQALLAKSGLAALSLFRYEPGMGAVVDLRNLTVSR